jgi:lipoprotein-anchoring transpeptidase ErfK/SrfK
VLALQQRLVELGYWMPEPDGRYGPGTAHAVTAFQKVQGLGRDGVAGPETRAAIASATRPTPADSSLPGRLLEVDLERQVTFVVLDGAVEWVLDISSGTASTPTNRGEFVIERQIDGLRISDLGRLWRPKYFDGGIAFHGAPSVPPYPASHGCVRLPNASIDWMWASDVAPVGTPVHVY